MIKTAIDYFLQEWRLVLTLAVALAIGGVYALRFLDIEAYPDPAPPIIEVITQNASWSAEEMEKQITLPLETALNGQPNLEHMRSISLFGLSDIKCYFSYASSYDADRQEVINRLGMVTLPPGIQAQLSPESTIGEIYRFQLNGTGFTLRELKEEADWTCVRYFKQVPGVVDVATFGGPTLQFHVDLDPRKLIAYHVSIPQVTTALANGNANAGGNYLDIGSQAFIIRGIGLFRRIEDIEDVVVAEKNGVPVYVRQLGRVVLGRSVPLGRVGRDGVEDIVEGIVLMRVGGQSLPTVEGVRKMAARLNNGILPHGMTVEPYVDRSDLVAVTTHTVRHTLLSGMVLVALVLVAFLGDLRAALIVTLTIPLALCFVIIILVLRGDSANLISMGAIDFGIIVDAAVIMIENVHRHLTQDHVRLGNVRLITSEAAKEVAVPVFFATIALFISFLPLFTMQGVEGKIFGPMAVTYGLALLGALILTFTFCPAAASQWLQQSTGSHETFLVRCFRRPYAVLLKTCVGYPWLTLLVTTAVFAATALVAPRLGGEFMPKLEEGNLWVRASMPLSIAYGDASRIVNRVRAVFDDYPEVVTVVSQLGRPDDGTDTASYNNGEFYVGLRPREEWPGGLTKDALVDEMNDRLEREFPGVDFNFSQNIEDNVEEAMSGVKGENSVKIFGTDLATLEHTADQIQSVMKDVRGVEDLSVFHELGQPNVLVTANRQAAARYGLEVGDINAVISAAIGGTAVTQVLREDRRFDVVVRLLEPFRDSTESIRRIPIMSPDGESVPLGSVADVSMQSGAAFIYREDNNRYIPVKFSVRGRDLQGTIAEADARIHQQVKLPSGYYLQWSGEVEQLEHAMDRLRIIVPVTLLVILFLLNKTFNSMADAVLVLLTVPLAAVGGIWALFIRHVPLSVSAGVGFISLLGVCTLQGVLLVSRIKAGLIDHLTPLDAILEAGEQRMRPVLMVAATAGLGLLPAALATGIGSETQRPLATVVVAGMFTTAVVNLLVLPALYRLAHRVNPYEVEIDST